MEYKNASEIKPKDIINDPDDNTLYVVINTIPGNNQRLVLRNFLTQKITQRSVPPNKQFLLIEPEVIQLQLNYYRDSTLNVMNPETFEESEIDGSSLGERLEPLKKAFDSGKSVYIELEKVDTFQNVKDFIIKEEKVVSTEPPQQAPPPTPKKPIPIEGQQKPARVSPKPDVSTTTSSPPSKVVTPPAKAVPPSTKSEQLLSKESKKDTEISEKSKKQAPPQKTPPETPKKPETPLPIPPQKEVLPTPSIKPPSGTPIDPKAIKGLDDKIIAIFKSEYHINTLEDLINAKAADLAKIPKLNEKKINEWQKKASEILKKGAKK